jgi:dephospho-CoA kinase
MIVGLTGGIASGKTTVQQMFTKLGIPTISADAISKNLLETNPNIYQAIVAKFGNSCLTQNNEIDRKELRRKIFNSTSDRIWLENLLHPFIKQKIQEFGNNNEADYCIVEIPLLYEVNWTDSVDRALIVDTTEDLQLQRATARDNADAAEIKKILSTQLSREQRLQQAADFIYNDGDLQHLEQQVFNMHQKYLSFCKA